MAILDFIKKQFIDIIQWTESGDGVLAWRYPMADFETHAQLLSVKHPRVVEHYRAGHTIIETHGRGAASTEDLRQAMLHYRALFEDLIGTTTDIAQPVGSVREVETPRRVATPPVRDEERPH